MSNPWPSSFPSEAQNFGDLHVGNTKDDDAQIIDDDVREVDNAPDPVSEPIPVTPLTNTVKRATRLNTVTLNVDPTWTPTLLLPANADRVGLQIRATSTVATDFVGISSDPGQLQITPIPGRLYAGQNVSLDYHEGAVWVSAAGASAVVNVNVWETTK